MQEVDFASLTAREAGFDPTSSECGADKELYMQDCRRLLALGIKCWGGNAPGRLGPRVLNPDDHHDRAVIKILFAPRPTAADEGGAGPPLQLQQQVPAGLPAPPSSTTGEAPASAAGSATDAPQPMQVEATRWADLEPFRVRNGLDIFVVPNFAQTHLRVRVDPTELQRQLETYPTRGADDAIQPNVVQWVGGDNKALNYRGNTIPRSKIWLQRLPKEDGYLRYGYTGWQWNVLPATVSVEQCPEVLPLADRYDEWVAARGLPSANHYIATRYSDGKDNIGWHSDKDNDIAPGSLITVVKMGARGRPFEMCLPGEEKSPFFSAVLAPGTAVIMTLEANLTTKHQVPVVNEASPSGSIVFRTIKTVVSHDTVAKELSKRQRGTGASQPMEVEAAPAPAPTEAPPLLVPRSALPGLSLEHLVAELKSVLTAATLGEAGCSTVGQLLDSLVDLELSGQEMRDSGTPPPPRTCPACPRTCTAPARLPSLQPFTLLRPRAGACKLVNTLRKKSGASAPLKARADELYKQWTSDGDSEL